MGTALSNRGLARNRNQGYSAAAGYRPYRIQGLGPMGLMVCSECAGFGVCGLD